MTVLTSTISDVVKIQQTKLDKKIVWYYTIISFNNSTEHTMQMITISYSGIKHPDQEYQQKIVSAMESIGFTYDGSDMSFDEDMTHGLFFFAPEGNAVEVTEFDK